MIKAFKFFFITILLSYFAVWISNRPGKVKIIWQEYLIETNVVGLSVLFFFILLSLFFFLYVFTKIKNLPKNISNSKREKFLALGNQSLDDLSINLFLGDNEGLEKNSRKIKKYFKNEMFSTVMLFNSALSNNNFNEAKKYLKILRTFPKAKYISNRANVLINLRQNDYDEIQKSLLDFKKEFNEDIWVSEKLAKLYSQKHNWKLGWEALKDIKTDNKEFNNLKSILHFMSGNSILESLKISDQSAFILSEAIKEFINRNDFKKAVKLIEKCWPAQDCPNIVENFINFNLKNNNDSLKRHKLLSKALKKYINDSDETKLALAMSAFKAKIWGESQQYLDDIPKDSWDVRMKNLYKDISKKSEKISLPDDPKNIKPTPMWFCSVCNTKFEKWLFVCESCNSVDSVKWTKKKIKLEKKFLLENPFRHFPKMK